MSIGRTQRQYGRIEIGQRVEFERLEAAPTPEIPWRGRGIQTVTIRTRHIVTDIRPCDSGALVTLTDSDGCQRRECFNAYGQMWGGFGSLTVLHEAPCQGELIRRAA